jgi:sec-independent protein translocase protein TatC
MFAAPGLHRNSRLFGLAAIPIATLFFAGGMAFTYFILMPSALPWLLSFMGMTTIPRPLSYIQFTTGLMFWIGAAFEFPLIIYVLARVGLIKAEVLAKQWRLAVVVIAIVAAAITPTIDPVNMSLVMGPMIVLYFLSIGLAKLAQRGREKKGG